MPIGSLLNRIIRNFDNRKMKRSDLVLTLGQRLFFLLCVFIVCYLLTALSAYMVSMVLASRPDAAVRISAVLQDVFTFVVPAIATAVMMCRKPAQLLCVAKVPPLSMIFLVAAVLFVSIPAQEAVIYWNYNIELPSAFDGFVASARNYENNAFETLKTMMGDNSVGALVVNILIVGVAAGFSEELLFRGCFQRLLTTGGVNVHVAVWTVALCFSALHMQFFGFVPRVLLGAYFGYLLVWSGSLWLPVAAHVLNNVMFVLTAWHQSSLNGVESLSNEPSLWGWPTTLLSVLLTTGALVLMWRLRRVGSSES